MSVYSRLCSDPVFSDALALNTRVPQGCVLSVVLFSIYKNISCNNSVLILIKFADDIALVGRLKDEVSLSQYYLQIELLNCCSRPRFFEVLGGGKGRQTARAASIDNQEVEIVNSFKYLGTSVDQNLTFLKLWILCTRKLNSVFFS